MDTSVRSRASSTSVFVCLDSMAKLELLLWLHSHVGTEIPYDVILVYIFFGTTCSGFMQRLRRCLTVVKSLYTCMSQPCCFPWDRRSWTKLRTATLSLTYEIVETSVSAAPALPGFSRNSVYGECLLMIDCYSTFQKKSCFFWSHPIFRQLLMTNNMIQIFVWCSFHHEAVEPSVDETVGKRLRVELQRTESYSRNESTVPLK